MTATIDIDLRKLNSATKYPSIPTYHAMGERGALLDEVVSFAGQSLIGTEKIDGTNSRIILMPDGCYLIGSREELLYARGDLVHNPALGIVDTLRETAERICQLSSDGAMITTVYLETYGGKTTGAAKQYTGCQAFGYRMFDVARVPLDALDRPLEEIASWREHGGQTYADEAELQTRAAEFGIELTPRIELDAELPTSIEGTHAWLQRQIPNTQASLDAEAGGRPEGLVVRTADRQTIAKIRYEDYRRHEKRRKR